MKHDYSNDPVTVAVDHREVIICNGDAAGLSTVTLHHGRKHPKTLPVLATILFKDAETWQRQHLPHFVPNTPGKSYSKSAERQWLRQQTKGLWSLSFGGDGIFFEIEQEAFWYRMFRC